MAQQMQGSQPPVQAVQSQVLGEPVLELVLALRQSGPSMMAEGRQTHSVEALDVADVLVDVELHLGRQGSGAPAGPRDEGHVGWWSGGLGGERRMKTGWAGWMEGSRWRGLSEWDRGLKPCSRRAYALGQGSVTERCRPQRQGRRVSPAQCMSPCLTGTTTVQDEPRSKWPPSSLCTAERASGRCCSAYLAQTQTQTAPWARAPPAQPRARARAS